jgi:hypothetical protein
MRRSALRPFFALGLLAALGVLAPRAGLAEEYLALEQFLALAFPEAPPASRTVWLTADMKREAEQMLGAAPQALRVRYWAAGERTAWILDEIGKEQPITIGVVVDRHRIEQVRVMAFRESRGWEIRHAFFTDQYRGIDLAGDGTLSREVDGITGATLSVRAVNRAARLALWLDNKASPGLAAR